MRETRLVIVVFVILALPSLAHAQSLDMVDVPNLNVQAPTQLKPKGVTVIQNKIEPVTQIRTYEDNVTRENMDKSRALFKRANSMFEKRELRQALELYKKAYSMWPHPRILFNMGVTLALMGRPLEAALMFKKVLEYGPDPVTPIRYKEARDKYLELMGTLAILEVKCSQEGAQVFVDGMNLGVCPFTKRITLTAGRHLVTAKKSGFVPFNRDIVLPASVIAGIDIHLSEVTKSLKLKKVERYPISWALTSAIGGIVLLAAGSGMVYYGRSEIDAILMDVNNFTSINGNKVSFQDDVYDEVREERAITMQKIGLAMLGVGTVALLTSGYFYLFRYKLVPVVVTPTSDMHGAALSFGFEY